MAYIEQVLRNYPEQVSKLINRRLGEIEEEIKLLTAPLIKERHELLMALKEIRDPKKVQTLHQEELSLEEIVGLSDAYDTKSSNIDKTIFVLKKNGWLSLNDIANKIHLYEPKSDPIKIRDTLSSVLRMEVVRENSRVKRRKNNEDKWEYNVV